MNHFIPLIITLLIALPLSAQTHSYPTSFAPPCRWSNDLPKIQRALAFDTLLKYRPAELQPWLPATPLLTITARLYQQSSKTYLQLRFAFAVPQAQTYYGRIMTNYLVRIILLNGEKIYLPVVRNYPPSTLSATTHYQIDLQLNEHALSALRLHGIDKIGLFWETGYEEYDVRYVDVLRNQARCLQLTSKKTSKK